MIEKLIRPVQDLLFFPIINHAIKDIQFRFVEKIHSLPWEVIEEHGAGELLSRSNRISYSARFFFKTVCLSFFPVFCKFLVLTYLLFFHRLYAILVVSFLSLYFLLVKKGLDRYSDSRQKAWASTDVAVQVVHQSLQQSQFTRFFKTNEMEKVKKRLEKEAEGWLKNNREQNRFQIQLSLFMTFFLLILSLLGIYLVKTESLLLGDFVWFQGQCLALFLPMKLLTIELRQFQESMIDIQQVRKFLTMEEKKEMKIPFLVKEAPLVSLKQVYFSYPEKDGLFKNFSFTLHEGDKIFLQGPNGSGKTTFAKLLSGIYSPKKGAIKIFGQETSSIKTEEISKWIQRLTGENVLFQGTLLENITFGNAHVEKKKIEEIVEALNFKEVIDQLPSKWDYFLGPREGRLSEGEKTKLILARTLLHPPKLLILDEALNALSFDEIEKILPFLAKWIPSLLIISHKNFSYPFFTHYLQMKEILQDSIANEIPAITD